MRVKRIVADIFGDDVSAAKRFYGDVLGLDVLMDLGWIATYGSDEHMPVQISFASEGGSGTNHGAYGDSSCAIRSGGSSTYWRTFCADQTGPSVVAGGAGVVHRERRGIVEFGRRDREVRRFDRCG
jgi:predicted enzyme related to lactoylglutathione lyase